MTLSSLAGRSVALAPFRVRSFRFQWPSDLAASWAFEMETLILGWYVLVESGSVKLLVLFGALQYLGSLFSPMFGVAGDRVGYRRLLWMTRAAYAALALLLGVLAATHSLTPVNVLVIAAIIGMIRPSDLMMRYGLIAQTLPAGQLLGALGVSRITSDSARIAGALAGAGAVTAYGIASAYWVVTLLYVVSFALALGVARHPPTDAGGEIVGDSQLQRGESTGMQERCEQDGLANGQPNVQKHGQKHGQKLGQKNGQQYGRTAAKASALQDLLQAFRYVGSKPDLLGAMTLAFLVNLLAFPFVLGLLPYVAKNIYGVGQTELGFLVAAFAFGALLASIVLAANRFVQRAARTMIVAGACWFAVLLMFALVTQTTIGMVLLMLAGFAQSLCLTPLAAVMLRSSAPEYRGRVMGMRLLAVWGLPAGLLISGPLIDSIGFAATTLGYAGLGLLCTVAMAWRWRAYLWSAQAPANLPTESSGQ